MVTVQVLGVAQVSGDDMALGALHRAAEVAGDQVGPMGADADIRAADATGKRGRRRAQVAGSVAIVAVRLRVDNTVDVAPAGYQDGASRGHRRS